MIDYHDREWGTPVWDDRELYEHLVLDGMQAGLSWRTILHKREAFRKAFDGFDPQKIARYNGRKVAALMNNAGIIRNRLKIESAITSARAWLDLQQRHSFATFLWDFVDGCPIHNRRRRWQDCPAQTRQSKAMSKALLQRGFKFVGPTICYAFMQAVGMVNDHCVGCFRHAQLQARRP